MSHDFFLWEESVLEKSGGLFILDTWNLSLYTVCFFCGELTKILQKIDGLSIEDNNRKFIVPVLRNYINKFEDFSEHMFAVGYNIYKPFFYGPLVEELRNHSVYEGIGIERELLVILSEKLNFVCLMIPFTSYQNSWAAVVDAVGKNLLDFAISGITLTLPRTEIVDFTTSIRAEPYSVLYSLYDDPWMSWKYILLPFSSYVWLTLAATVFAISFLLYRSVDDVPFVFFIQGWLRLLFEQSLPNFHNCLKSKWYIILIIFMWFMLALIINFSYKSKLISSLINSKTKEYNTIDELVDNRYYFQMNDFDSTVLQENLRLSADPNFLEILKRSDNKTSYCNAILKITTNKFAIIDENTLMQDMVLEKCTTKLSPRNQDYLRLLRDDIFTTTHAWPMQLNSPYRVSFNRIISRLKAAGLFAKWTEDFYPPWQVIPRSHQRHIKHEAPRFTMASMLGPGIIWLLGLSISALVFIFERIRLQTQ